MKNEMKLVYFTTFLGENITKYFVLNYIINIIESTRDSQACDCERDGCGFNSRPGE